MKEEVAKKEKGGLGLIALPALLAILFLPYANSLGLLPFADDFYAWNVVANAKSIKALLFHPFFPEFFRPLEFLLIRFNIAITGMDPVVYRLAVLVGHLLTVASVYLLSRKLRCSKVESLIAAAVFGLLESNAMAVMSNDTAGQVFSVLCGNLALAAFLTPEDKWSVLKGAGWFFVALLWKDSAVIYGALCFVAMAAKEIPQKRFKRLLIGAGVLAVAFGLYFLWRKSAGVASPDLGGQGRYAISFGTNLLVNMVYLLGAVITPFGATMILGIPFNVVSLGLKLTLAILWVVILLAGFIRSAVKNKGKSDRTILLVLILLLSMFPDCLLSHVSELYTYKPGVFFSIIAGVCLVSLFQWIKDSSTLNKMILLGLLALVALGNVASIQHKQTLLAENGNEAKWILSQIQKRTPKIKPGTGVVFVKELNSLERQYSVYYMDGLDLIGDGRIITAPNGVHPAWSTHVTYNKMRRIVDSVPDDVLVVRYRNGIIEVDLK